MMEMTRAEQQAHVRMELRIEAALFKLRESGCDDEDIIVAIARIENWKAENERRWVR